MIVVDKLTKYYGSKAAIVDVSFTAHPGRVTALLGPNGAGKSTTMRLILGLDTATTGSALIMGRPYRHLNNPLTVVGAQFDGSGAHKGRTAKAHLTWVALSNGISTDRVSEVLRLVGLEDIANKRVGEFSLGMGQRLGIATALLGDPAIIILDEPMNGLDAEGIRWIRRLLTNFASQGKTVLISSHLMSEIEAVADELVVIAQGRVVQQGSVNGLVRGYANLEDAYFAWTNGKEDYAVDTADGRREMR